MIIPYHLVLVIDIDTVYRYVYIYYIHVRIWFCYFFKYLMELLDESVSFGLTPTTIIFRHWYDYDIIACRYLEKECRWNEQTNGTQTCAPTSCSSAELTGSCSMSVLIAVWSKGQALRCSLFRHILQTVWPQPRLMGRRTVSSNVCVQMGHSRNSVHCGAWTGIVTGTVYMYEPRLCRVRLMKQNNNNKAEDSTGIRRSLSTTTTMKAAMSSRPGVSSHSAGPETCKQKQTQG